MSPKSVRSREIIMTKLRGLFTAVTILTTLAGAQAANRTWLGTSSDKWNNDNNWSGALTPTSADVAVYGNRGSIPQPVINGTGTANRLNFSGTGSWNFTGNGTVNVGTGGVDNTGSGSNTVAVTLNLFESGTSGWNAGGVADSMTFSGTITGAAGNHFEKQGTGTTTFSANNTYLGTTTVSAGTFFINGNQTAATGAVNVNAGTLGGIGTVGGNTTIANAAFLSPGQNNVGKITFAKNLTFNDGAKLTMQINGTTRGTTYDAIDFGATSILAYEGDLTLNINTSLANSTTIDLLGASLGGISGNFDSVTLNGTGGYVGPLSNLGGGNWGAAFGGQIVYFSTNTGDLTVVPEPAAVVLFGLGSAFLLFRRRRA